MIIMTLGLVLVSEFKTLYSEFYIICDFFTMQEDFQAKSRNKLCHYTF